MKKVVYFSRAGDAVALARKLAGQGYACLMEEPSTPVLSPLPVLDSDETEQAFTFLFVRLRDCGEFEARVIHAQLFTHYPRLYRGVQAASRKPGQPAAYFFPKERLSVYDLALAFDGPCEFEVLDGERLEPAGLDRMVEFYEPREAAPAQAEPPAPGWAARLGGWLRPRKTSEPGPAHPARPAHPTRVLFLAHDNESNLYLRPLQAIFTELGQRGIPFEIISCDANARRFLDEEQVAHRALSGLLAEQAPDGAGDAAAMAQWFEQASEGAVVRSGDALYDRLFRLALNSAVRRDVWQSHQQSLLMEAHIGAQKVTDVFFVPDGTPIVTGLAHGLARMDVRMHTVVAAGVSRFKRAVAHYLAQNIYVAGLDARDAMLHHFPSREVVPVGNPVLDRYLSRGEAALPADRRKVVLIGTSGYDADEGAWIADAAARLDAQRFLLVLKPHPSYAERYAGLQAVLVERGHILARAADPIEPLVNAAQIVVTDHSQVGIDAHLLGKPVISMYAGPGDILYMKHISSIRYVRSVDALLGALDAAAEVGAPAQDFVDAFNFHGDRHYYRRVVDNIVHAQPDRKP